MKRPFSGGGTDITNAVSTAISDIKNGEDAFDKVEIMLITDGDDSGFRIGKSDLGDIKLHATIIDGRNSQLEQSSETYTEISTGNIQTKFMESGLTDDEIQQFFSQN